MSREEQAKKANRAQRFGGLPQEPSETKDETMEEAGMEVGTYQHKEPIVSEPFCKLRLPGRTSAADNQSLIFHD